MPYNVQFSRVPADNTGGNKKKELAYKLTHLGQQKLDELSGNEHEFDVMECLREKKYATSSEIAEDTKLGINRVRADMQVLVNRGYAIVYTGSSS
jgi:transcription initiation factor IIE alpha subunit